MLTKEDAKVVAELHDIRTKLEDAVSVVMGFSADNQNIAESADRFGDRIGGAIGALEDVIQVIDALGEYDDIVEAEVGSQLGLWGGR